jgi:PAS domain S-box-containing protein
MVLCGGGTLVYALLFPLVHSHIGDAFAILAMIPVVFAAFTGGVRCGVVSGVLIGIVLNPLLFAFVESNPRAVTTRPATIIGAVLLVTVGALVGHLRDLRCRLHRALQRTRSKAEALAESEHSFRMMFETASDGLGLVDVETGRFIMVNPALCRLFGYSVEELSHRTPRALIRPGDESAEARAFAVVREGGELVGRDAVMIAKDGEEVNVLLSAKLLRWKGRECVYTAISDITALTRMHRAVKRKNDELLAFTDVAVHDLRRPLTAMKVTVEMLKRGAFEPGSNERRELLSSADKAVGYMEEQLDDLLACARLEAGTAKLSRTSVALNELIDEVLTRLKPEIEAKGIEIGIDVHDCHISADRRSLNRVLMNLLGNAVAYSRDTVRPRIDIGCTARGDGWEITVADNGIGVPPRYRECIFEKFKRGGNVGGISGTGLGLSVVKAAVEAHGGNVWFESTEGVGTMFHVTIARDA